MTPVLRVRSEGVVADSDGEAFTCPGFRVQREGERARERESIQPCSEEGAIHPKFQGVGSRRISMSQGLHSGV